MIKDPRVRGDSLVWMVEQRAQVAAQTDWRGPAGSRAVLSLQAAGAPIDSIQSFELRKFSLGKTALFTGFWIGLSLVAGAVGMASEGGNITGW